MADLSRIRARLEALRNMTTDNGCTEAEALAAASKMADRIARRQDALLAQHKEMRGDA